MNLSPSSSTHKAPLSQLIFRDTQNELVPAAVATVSRRRVLTDRTFSSEVLGHSLETVVCSIGTQQWSSKGTPSRPPSE